MDTPTPQREPDVLNDTLRALRNHGLVAEIERKQPTLGRTRADALVRISYGKHDDALYAAEIKRWLTPATLGAALARLRELGPTALLITDYATPQVAQKLKELDIAFADAAGNAYLRGANFLIWLEGRRLPAATKRPRAGRAWQPTGLKLIFALLCNPDWIQLGYRELAGRAGVANGTVGWVFRELIEQDFVVQRRRRALGRQLRNKRKLLERWVEVYAATFRQTTLLGRYRTETLDFWKTLDTGKYGVLLGGEPAAAVLTGYLRPGIATFYANDVVGPLLLDHRLRTAADGNVEIRERFWKFEYAWEHQNLVPPVLVYADLLATGDGRCIETAHHVYDGYLARLFTER